VAKKELEAAEAETRSLLAIAKAKLMFCVDSWP